MKPSDTHYKNGQIIKIQNGDSLTWFFIDGRIKAQGPFINDMMEGEWVFYKKEGFLWQVAHFLHNKKTGLWLRYDANGNIVYREKFK